jgi:hypothetical protein
MGMRVMRRLWWATLPHWYWVADEDEWEDAPSPPWYAYPLAWLHRRVDALLANRDVFGPRFNAGFLIGTRASHRPWL